MNTGDYQWVPLRGPDIGVDVRLPEHTAGQFTIVQCRIEACFNSSPIMVRYVESNDPGQFVHKCDFVLRHVAHLDGYPKWTGVPTLYQESIEHEFNKFISDYVVVSVPIYDKDGRIVG